MKAVRRKKIARLPSPAASLPLLAVLVALVALAAPARLPAQEAPGTPEALAGLDAYVEEVMEAWSVPGLAIAVVEDGEVVLSRGYGLRDIEAELPVTPATLFAIGSITKSMTTTVVGTLAGEGKLDADDPVREHLPDFRLHDDGATARLTVRDLLSHRSGLPRHDLLWYGSGLTREELYRRLRHLEPSEDLRNRWQYQNLMFMTAGILAGEVAGSSWEELVRERIFRPLGMTRSNLSVTVMAEEGDAALPYVEVEDSLVRVPYRNLDEIGPAGSVNSSVEEMIRYVEMHLGGGALVEDGDTVRVVPEEWAGAMQRPQMVIPGEPDHAELGYDAYGLGLFVTTYRGRKLVHHGGGIDGFISLLSFMPREGIGIIVLTNRSGLNPAPQIVSRRVYDRLLGLEPVDWLARIREEVAEFEERREEVEAREAEERVEGTTPSHPLEAYVGVYEHPGYGAVEVRGVGAPPEGESAAAEPAAGEAEEGRGGSPAGLRLHFHGEAAPLEHRHYDIFRTPDDPLLFELGDLEVQFFYDRSGAIDRLAIPLEPNVDDIVFEKVTGEGEDGGGTG